MCPIRLMGAINLELKERRPGMMGEMREDR